MIFLKLLKALYGCLKSARMFQEHLSQTLSKFGFEKNPYDSCVANKEIKGSQCTIIWHVDDLKVSHKLKKVVEEVVESIEGVYGKMNVVSGKEHTYLGTKIVYGEKYTVSFSVKDYVTESI